jgi:hypothetical protein
MSNVRAPQFFVDLVSDLRDRRLLLPAGLLAAALVAVPLLLSTSSEPPPPPPVSPSAASLEAGTQAQPAVLAEAVTVRDYRKRLDELKSTNPFESGFNPPAGAAAAAAALDDLLPAGGGGSPGGVTDPTAALGGGAGGAPATGTSTSTSSGSSGGSSGGGGSTQTEVRYFAYEIDVSVGELGDLDERDGIENLTLLPKDAKPVLMFLGVNRDGNKAVFLVSGDVSSTSGDGACAPSASSCEFLTMREGDSRTFDYTPDGLTYRLVLRKIKRVELDKAPATKVP